MFERLARLSRFSRTPPEFLLTHPVNQSRIADSRNRAEQLPGEGRRDSVEYQMMRARVQLHHERNPGLAVQRFRTLLDEHDGNHAAARYGLVLALTRSGQHAEAAEALEPLFADYADNVAVNLAAIELDTNRNQPEQAMQRLDRMLQLNPGNYPLLEARADLLLRAQRYQDAERAIDSLANQRSNDPDIWYLAGDLEQAGEQLTLASRRAGDNYMMTARIEARQKDLAIQREILQSF